IARAASLTPDVAPEAELAEMAAESGLNAARALLGRPVRGASQDLAATTVELGPAAATVRIDSRALAAAAATKTTEITTPVVDDWQGVIDVLERALLVAPDDADLRADLGVAHTRKASELRETQKDYVLALSHVRRALALLPDDPEAFALLE